jgi:hypothetical protein
MRVIQTTRQILVLVHSPEEFQSVPFSNDDIVGLSRNHGRSVAHVGRQFLDSSGHPSGLIVKILGEVGRKESHVLDGRVARRTDGRKDGGVGVYQILAGPLT